MPNMFCLTSFPITKAQIKKMKEIAKENDVSFVYCGDRRVSPASGWFEAPDLGWMGNRHAAKAVRDAIDSAGLSGILRN